MSRVRGALSSVPGVRKVEVDYPKKEASCTVEKSEYDPNKLLAALERAGYPDASMKSAPSSDRD